MLTYNYLITADFTAPLPVQPMFAGFLLVRLNVAAVLQVPAVNILVQEASNTGVRKCHVVFVDGFNDVIGS